MGQPIFNLNWFWVGLFSFGFGSNYQVRSNGYGHKFLHPLSFVVFVVNAR